PKSLDEERVSPDEILQVARESGLESLDQVKWAILQSDGNIAIVPKASEKQGAGAGRTGPRPRPAHVRGRPARSRRRPRGPDGARLLSWTALERGSTNR